MQDQLSVIACGLLFFVVLLQAWQLYATWQLGQALTWLVKAMPGINILEKALMQPAPVVQAPAPKALNDYLQGFQDAAGPASSVDIPKDVAGMASGTFGGPDVSEDEVYAAIARTRAARMGEE